MLNRRSRVYLVLAFNYWEIRIGIPLSSFLFPLFPSTLHENPDIKVTHRPEMLQLQVTSYSLKCYN